MHGEWVDSHPHSPSRQTPQDETLKGESAHFRIREAITTGYFRPGERLAERDLSVLLQMSRTPVREALVALEREGLVVAGPHHRYTVTPVSIERAHHVFAVREPLEELATRLATRGGNREIFDQLVAVLHRAEEAAGQGDIATLIRTNQAFHRGIAQASGNPYLTQVLHGLQGHVGQMMSTSLALPSRPRETLQEHWAILNAMRSGDEESAVESCRIHMCHALKAAEACIRARDALIAPGPAHAVE